MAASPSKPSSGKRQRGTQHADLMCETKHARGSALPHLCCATVLGNTACVRQIPAGNNGSEVHGATVTRFEVFDSAMSGLPDRSGRPIIPNIPKCFRGCKDQGVRARNEDPRRKGFQDKKAWTMKVYQILIMIHLKQKMHTQ